MISWARTGVFRRRSMHGHCIRMKQIRYFHNRGTLNKFTQIEGQNSSKRRTKVKQYALFELCSSMGQGRSIARGRTSCKRSNVFHGTRNKKKLVASVQATSSDLDAESRHRWGVIVIKRNGVHYTEFYSSRRCMRR